MALYAKAGVPEYWIVNVKDYEIEVYSDLRDLKYRNRRTYTSDEEAPFPGGAGKVSATTLR